MQRIRGKKIGARNKKEREGERKRERDMKKGREMI